MGCPCDPHLNQTKFNDLLPLTIDGVLDTLSDFCHLLTRIIWIDWFRAEKKVFAALPQFQGALLFGQWGLKLLRWFVLSHFISTVSNSCTIMQYFVLVSSVCSLSPSVSTLQWCLWIKTELRWGAVGGGSGAQSEVFKAFRALRWLQRGVTCDDQA